MKKRAIPQGYMTVGEIAKEMGVTVRTMQYYDKQGVLSPSSESEGRLRLYTQQDIVKLYQIQAMKYLGFSLEDIKIRLSSIDTPKEMSNILVEQARGIREKICSLRDSLKTIEKLNAEVAQMETVDWAKCADIIVLLQAKSDSYRAIKHFDNNVIEHIHNRFDKKSGKRILNTLNRLNKRVIRIKKSGLPPESEQGQVLAKDWWDMVMDFTGGDMSLLPELSKLANIPNENIGKDRFEIDFEFIDKALTVYFANLGHNPFNEKEV